MRLLALIAFLPCLSLAQPAPLDRPPGWADKPLVRSARAMVVAANPLATQAGLDMLAAGGSAIDAAIAAQLVLNLVEPESSGIGGGAFLVHWDERSRRVETYDGRETAPRAATPTLFLDARGQPLSFAAAQIGGRAVGTPGLLRMLELAHREHGRLPWAALFAPAIAAAGQGYPVSPRLHRALAGASAALKDDAAARALYFDAAGAAKPVGAMLRNPEFAQTLRAIAEVGADAFYTGAIATDLAARVQGHPANPGTLSTDDLAAYRAVKRAPLCGKYRERTICGMGMPSSGTATMLMTLRTIERHDVAAMGAYSADAVHLIAEAYRLAYADRAQYMADADFVDVPLDGLLDDGYVAQRAAAIDLQRSMGAPAHGRPPGCCAQPRAAAALSPEAGTSHLSIVDAQGNAVALTTTIESGFGSHLMVRGFFLNNQLTDFSFVPAGANGEPVANRVEPGKRPRSSMTPVLVFDPQHRLDAVIGSPGGSAIIQYVTKTIVGLYDWKLDAQQAVALGNFGAQTSAVTQLERGTPVAPLSGPLRSRGHTVALVEFASGLHAIRRANEVRSGYWGAAIDTAAGWTAGADPRRDGVAMGF